MQIFPGDNSHLSPFETSLYITSRFEGTSYSTVSGDFDGMGISCGILQWNLGQGTLQAYILRRADLSKHSFPEPIAPLVHATNADAVTWVKQKMTLKNGNLKPEWSHALRVFMASPDIVKLQQDACGKYWLKSGEVLKDLGIKTPSKRQRAWAFDLAVQNGSLKGAVPIPAQPDRTIEHARTCIQQWPGNNAPLWDEHPITHEQAHLIIASHLRAKKSRHEYQADVFARKATIAMGIGYVHRTLFQLNTLLD